MIADPRHWLYTGKVFHRRVGVAAHAFVYPALFLCFPLSRRAELAGGVMGYNRFNLFAFHEADHGDGKDALAWIHGILRDAGLGGLTAGEVWLQTQPRVFGFVFNPVSFWYCHDQDGDLKAVLAEVKNTFGERHCYLLTAPGHAPITDKSVLDCRKCFHVSPFHPVAGEYRFRFHRTAVRSTVAIHYYIEDRLQLKTAVTGAAKPLSSRELLKALIQQGWSTLLVVLRIHRQALTLWRKGAVFHRKPAPPVLEISS